MTLYGVLQGWSCCNNNCSERTNKCVQDITFVVLAEYNWIVDGLCLFAIAVVGIVHNMTACSH